MLKKLSDTQSNFYQVQAALSILTAKDSLDDPVPYEPSTWKIAAAVEYLQEYWLLFEKLKTCNISLIFYKYIGILKLKHISWSWNVSGPDSAASHNPKWKSLLNLKSYRVISSLVLLPRKRLWRTSAEESMTLPWSKYSWLGMILLLRAEVSMSMAEIGFWFPAISNNKLGSRKS